MMPREARRQPQWNSGRGHSFNCATGGACLSGARDVTGKAMPDALPPPPIPEDMEFQQRNWAVERIGWAAMAALVLLALLGLFAGGPLGAATAASDDGALRVEYERFARRTARSHFTVLTPRGIAGGETAIRIGPRFAEFYDIESLQLHPMRSAAGAAGLELAFAPAAAGDLMVPIAARARRFGIVRIEIAVEGGGRVEFTQLIYP
jgi:hypothetical protein